MSVDRPLVITGASGFVGRRLLRMLARDQIENVTLLLNKTRPAADASWLPSWTLHTGGLVDTPIPALPEGCVILHLAAATGKASPEAMRTVNVGGTQALLDAAGKAHAAHMIFVSSIAAGFPDRRWYPYAETKRLAEELVQASGLSSTILRPTMIFGSGSAVQKGLSTLATAPWPVVFGSGDVRVQPIFADDVARLLYSLAVRPPDAVMTPVEVGGPEQLTIAELMARLRKASGASARSALHLPVGVIRRALALVEPILRPVMPLTAGQLASFVNDGIAAPHPLMAERLPNPLGLKEMLADR